MESDDALKTASQRKVALRELPNGSRRSIDAEFLNGAANFKGRNSSDAEFPKISGTKRPHPGCSRKQENISSSGSIDTDMLLLTSLHQRRKIEADACMVSKEIHSPISTGLNLKSSHVERSQPKVGGQRQDPAKPPVSCSTFVPFPINNSAASPNNNSLSAATYSRVDPATGFPVAAAHDHSSSNAGVSGDSQASKLHWKERFLRLQAFLKAYDRSSQQDYIQMLRSLSSAGRSKHAVELEKRAIQLLVEEGRELSRMQVLNVLGKDLPPSVPSMQLFPSVPSMQKK